MIKIGTDIISTKRIEKLIGKFGNKAKQRFMSEDEIINTKSFNSIAGIWAVKEAVSKALKCGIGADFGFNDVEVIKDNKNAPYLKFNQDIVEKFGIIQSDVSISHDMDFAIAVVILETD
jgi:holo-[acyl-carrier protein] synthase